MVILLAALLAGASVADAERAFAAKAASDGQWTAFRAFAAPDAIMYAPGPISVQRLLAGKPDPAEPLRWRPQHTITSCDGTLAYSTGPWSGPAGHGSFGTIWRRDADGWRWIYDGGHEGGAARDGLVEDQAACPAPAGSLAPPADSDGAIPIATLRTGALAGLIEASDGAMPVAIDPGAVTALGQSIDRTLVWRINALSGKPGAHLLRMWSWDGRRYRLAVLDYSTGG